MESINAMIFSQKISTRWLLLGCEIFLRYQIEKGVRAAAVHSAVNIDSVKIKTSPILMMRISLREWFISATNHLGRAGDATSPIWAMPNAHVFGGGSNEGSPTHPQKHGQCLFVEHVSYMYQISCYISIPDDTALNQVGRREQWWNRASWNETGGTHINISTQMKQMVYIHISTQTSLKCATARPSVIDSEGPSSIIKSPNIRCFVAKPFLSRFTRSLEG